MHKGYQPLHASHPLFTKIRSGMCALARLAVITLWIFCPCHAQQDDLVIALLAVLESLQAVVLLSTFNCECLCTAVLRYCSQTHHESGYQTGLLPKADLKRTLWNMAWRICQMAVTRQCSPGE